MALIMNNREEAVKENWFFFETASGKVYNLRENDFDVRYVSVEDISFKQVKIDTIDELKRLISIVRAFPNDTEPKIIITKDSIKVYDYFVEIKRK